MRRERGFTLIELMIVIAIIAILAGILVPNFLKARAQGQLAACESNLRNTATALEEFATANDGRYPSQLTQLVSENYLRSLSKCPSSDKSYGYVMTSQPDNFTLYCVGTAHKAAGITATDYPEYSPGIGLMTAP